MKTVFRASNAIEANIVKGLLESHDIPAHIQGEHMSMAYGGLVSGLDARIQVEALYEKRAKQIIDEYLEKDQES